MTVTRAVIAFYTLMIVVPFSGLAVAGSVDPVAAEAQFTKSCGTCHTAEPGGKHRQGPNLNGVYGRSAGTVDDFKYSDVLAASGWIWDDATLAPWIENSQKAHPGTNMNYRQRKAEKRALILAYLKTLTPN